LKLILLHIILIVGFVALGQQNDHEYFKQEQTIKRFEKSTWKKMRKSVVREPNKVSRDSKSISDWSKIIDGEKDNWSEEEPIEFENIDYSDIEYEYEEAPSEGSFYDYKYERENGDYGKKKDEFGSKSTEGNYNHRKNSYFRSEQDRVEKDGYKSKLSDKRDNPSNIDYNKLRDERRSSESQGARGLGGSGLGLVYFLGAILLAAIVYYLFFAYSNKDTKVQYHENLEDLSPNTVSKTELQRRLEEAIGRDDYRAAIRIYFIFILKDLSDMEWIKWEKEKTNKSYLNEMISKSQHQQFGLIVRLYELAWYGKYNIGESQFKEMEPNFKSFLKSINSKQLEG